MLGPGIGAGVVVDAKVTERPHPELLELTGEPLDEAPTLGVSVLEQDRQRRADQRHAVEQPPVEETRIVDPRDGLPQPSSRHPGRDQGADDRARRGPGHTLEPVPALGQHRHRSHVPDGEHPAAGEDQIGLPVRCFHVCPLLASSL